MSKKTLTPREVVNLNDVIARCMSLIVQRGNMVSVDKTDDLTKTVLECNVEDVAVSVTFERHDFTESAVGVLTVTVSGEIVLQAGGAFFEPSYEITLLKYSHGDWEDKIPPRSN